jgi:hypothetical protein
LVRYNGRPVLFFFNVSALSAATWQRLREQVDPGRSALWIAEGTDLQYLAAFDGHHLYSVTWPNRIPPSQTLSAWGERVRKYNREHGTAKLWVATVMPGYDDRKARPGSGFACSRAGGDYYRQTWQAAIASKPHWIVINSFNEWPEGSYIEPSQAHGTLYMDLTREWAARFKGAEFTASAAAAPPPAPTSARAGHNGSGANDRAHPRPRHARQPRRVRAADRQFRNRRHNPPRVPCASTCVWRKTGCACGWLPARPPGWPGGRS